MRMPGCCRNANTQHQTTRLHGPRQQTKHLSKTHRQNPAQVTEPVRSHTFIYSFMPASAVQFLCFGSWFTYSRRRRLWATVFRAAHPSVHRSEFVVCFGVLPQPLPPLPLPIPCVLDGVPQQDIHTAGCCVSVFRHAGLRYTITTFSESSVHG